MTTDRQTQMLMDYRLPPGAEHVTAKELAAASGYTPQHIIDCYETGKIQGFASNARAKRGKEIRHTIRIPRENAVLFLCSVSNYDADMLLQELADVARRKLPPDLRRQLVQRLMAD